MSVFDNFSSVSKSNQWCVGVCDWIIEDGGYEDFKKNQYTEFALEFFPENWHQSSIQKKIAEQLNLSRYRINAEVVYLSSDEWILDFGICAYSEGPPSWAQLHDFVAAEIYLGIDVCGCSGPIYELPGVPPLIYSWNIDYIYAEKENHLLEIEQMDVWNDKFSHYNLICTKLENPPTRKFVHVDYNE